MPPRVERFVAALLGGLAFVAFVRALAEAILAPGRPSWRLVALGDRPAERIVELRARDRRRHRGRQGARGLEPGDRRRACRSRSRRRRYSRLLAALTLAELLRRFATTAARKRRASAPTSRPRPMSAGRCGSSAGAPCGGDRERARRLCRLCVFLVDQLVWIGAHPGAAARRDRRSATSSSAARLRGADPDRHHAPGQHRPAPALPGSRSASSPTASAASSSSSRRSCWRSRPGASIRRSPVLGAGGVLRLQGRRRHDLARHRRPRGS